jgi:2-polyprenyl-3-methyl-5-hydroxy-6-metoxy-1,4-benzoquinol methylase
MEWDKRMATTEQAEFPELNFVRFVRDNYYWGNKNHDRSRIRFLDLGCGGGANSWFLAHKGFHVTALDKSAAALNLLAARFVKERYHTTRIGFVQADIKTLLSTTGLFDCILDCNTLCHIQRPPWHTIHEMLKPKGKLFMVAPTPAIWKKTLCGKGYCRLATDKQIRHMLRMFSDVRIDDESYPRRVGMNQKITSWLVEASR